MGNCLVTKLKSTVDADLQKLGEIIICYVPQGLTGSIGFYHPYPEPAYIRAINGTLVDSSGEPLGIDKYQLPRNTDVEIYIKADKGGDAAFAIENNYHTALMHIGGSAGTRQNVYGDVTHYFGVTGFFHTTLDSTQNISIDVSKIFFTGTQLAIRNSNLYTGRIADNVITDRGMTYVTTDSSHIIFNIESVRDTVTILSTYLSNTYGNIEVLAQNLNINYNAGLYIGRPISPDYYITGTIEGFCETLHGRGRRSKLNVGLQSPGVTIGPVNDRRTTQSMDDMYIEFSDGGVIVHEHNTIESQAIATWNGSTWTYNLPA